MLHAWLNALVNLLKKYRKFIYIFFVGTIAVSLLTLAAGKIYQRWDDDPDRGAIAIADGVFGESYSTPVYLDQGWNAAESLWFYNTTQGSGLLPYDLFMALEQALSEQPFRSNANFDKFRYLPQKPTFFNPDGLAVGFTKDTYQGKSYIGYTCAACHTGQINFEGKAIRIDGGPAMADMVGFLTYLQDSMDATLKDDDKLERFINGVLSNGSDYSNADQVTESLKKWTATITLYNTINKSHIAYGYARLDAFGRIYNRVLEHVINAPQVRQLLRGITRPVSAGERRRIVTDAQAELVLEGIDDLIIGDEGFSLIFNRLESDEPGYPNLSAGDLLRVRDAIFNEPSAPVSYPFLWDTAHSDYVQWNGIAANAGVGPLGRNAGEVIGVFGILDWTASEPGFDLGALISGQKMGQPHIEFKSSIDLVNLQRLEDQLKSLTSPQWPENILGKMDRDGKANRGELIYAKYCQSCHEILERDHWDRIVIANMNKLKIVGTDPAMATHSVAYKGKSGNFKHIYQGVEGVGTVIVGEDAPVVQILTAATKGVVGTPDPDKWFLRRWADWVYTLGMSFFGNEIKPSVKAGNYNPDTTARPYSSLLSYKARSLNGIWATAPYLHNGSIPTLYDMMLPVKREGDPDNCEYRPNEFWVGKREFDVKHVGISYEEDQGSKFTTFREGDFNTGHYFATGNPDSNDCKIEVDPVSCEITATPKDCTAWPPLTKQQRWDLLEYLKTL